MLPRGGYEAVSLGRFKPDARGRRIGEIAGMTISMYESSVGVFCQFLGNLSDIVGHAAEHAAARGIDSSILLRARLYRSAAPQFFFHVTTAYDILRHNGVDIVKKNFLGSPRSPA